jgi:hypothetical protein
MFADTTCTCGESKQHSIARRKTADGTSVYLWNDGALTWPLGRYIEGGMHPRTAEQRERAFRVGNLVLGDIELYNDDEVSELIAAARWTVERDGLPATMRSRFASQRRKASQPTPVWRVMSADRNGKPTERVWVLPRLSPWRGHAVWDERRPSGRYHLHAKCTRTVVGVHRPADDVYEPTGLSFPTLDALLTWMAENPPKVIDA